MLCGPTCDTCVHRDTVHLLGPENRTKPNHLLLSNPAFSYRDRSLHVLSKAQPAQSSSLASRSPGASGRRT